MIKPRSISESMARSHAQEAADALAWKLGHYVKQACPHCGRYLLCACANGKHRCEKCNWCPEDGTYAPVNW